MDAILGDGTGVLIAWLLLSFAIMLYADRKGRSRLGFFFLSLFLSPLVGFVLLAASRPNPEKQGLRKCPQCAEFVKQEALKCRFCAFDFTLSAKNPHAAAAVLRR